MDDIFFYLSKIIWIVVSPDSLFVILLTGCLLLILFRKHKTANLLLGLLTLSTLFLSFISIGSWMLFPLESRFQHNPELPEQIDGIIVLGGSVLPSNSVEWQQLETNFSHERLSSFIQLAHQYPKAKLVFTGGNASLFIDRPSEAEIVMSHFVKSGIAENRLTLENKSRNTAENASLTKQIINPQAGENWVMITTAFHMPRAIGVFCQQNWPVIPFPVDHQTLPSKLLSPKFDLIGNANSLDLASHEWAGLLAYYLTGKIDKLVPDQCNYSN